MSAILIASIRELCINDHRNDPAILGGWLRNKTPALVLQMFDNPAVELWVAERQGDIAAVGGLNLPDAIGLNYIAPAHRFAGISRALLATLEQRLRERGITDARLTSTGTAHRFYLNAGWRDSGPPDSDRGMLAYPMAKRL